MPSFPTSTSTITNNAPKAAQLHNQPSASSDPRQQLNNKRADAESQAQAKASQQKESSEAAKKAKAAQAKAKELTQAAAGAGDPEERQKLLNEALQKEIEAETFGKTAKYLQSGAFQGAIAGSGLGSGIGLGLGAVVASLVGGVTGGLGGGIGFGVGAVHGPFVDIAGLAGEGVRKITGTIPGWKATEQQKKALERMVKGVKEQDRPNEDELDWMSQYGELEDGSAGEGGGEGKSKTWTETVGSYVPSKNSLPSMPSWGSKKQDLEVGNEADGKGNGEDQPTRTEVQAPAATQRNSSRPKTMSSQTSQVPGSNASKAAPAQSSTYKSQPRLAGAHTHSGNVHSTQAPIKNKVSSQRPPPARASSRTPDDNGAGTQQRPTQQPAQRKQPRKLEIRSQKSNSP